MDYNSDRIQSLLIDGYICDMCFIKYNHGNMHAFNQLLFGKSAFNL